MTELSTKLTYKRPAGEWTQALPIGNGSLGAMITGGSDCETLFLNIDTLWSGFKRTQPKKGSSQIYKKAQELALDDKLSEAENLLEKDFNCKSTEWFLPLGQLVISSKNHKTARNYKRSLDLETAVCNVQYTKNHVDIKREAFASSKENAIIYKIESNENKTLNFSCMIKNAFKNNITVEDNAITLKGICPSEIVELPNGNFKENYFENEQQGLKFCCKVGIKSDGKIECHKNSLSVSGAKSALIAISAQTNFESCDVLPFESKKDYVAPCDEAVKNVLLKEYNALKAEHIDDYKGFFDRVKIDLGNSNKQGLPTDKRLIAFCKKKDDVELYALLFNFGRYLGISASRPGTQAMTLQGIWTKDVTSPWRSNYTVNINTQMNYWPMLSCNLPEMCEPLNCFIKEIADSGVETAKEMYGARGFCSHHNIDLWRSTTPVPGRSSWSFWPMSGAWFCRHLYEYYEYTGDIGFLKDKAYPIMKSAAMFMADILVEDKDGYLIAAPSTSPENVFLRENAEEPIAVSQTTTMTMSIIKDLFGNCLSAAKALNINNDDEFISDISEKFKRLLPFRTGKDGRILEWYLEEKEEEINHRHTSHLYGLFPAELIDLDKTPELAAAAKKTLETRGDFGTGWSLGWKINFWARLRNKDKVIKLINNQLRYIPSKASILHRAKRGGGTYSNMFDAHPPFQIDGNFGATSGISQALLQSIKNRLIILPALPDEWKSGFINGLAIKGNGTVDISWENGKLKKLIIYGNGEYEVLYNKKSITANVSGKCVLNAEDF